VDEDHQDLAFRIRHRVAFTVKPQSRGACRGPLADEYLPQKIYGGAMFRLRLRELIPTIFVGSGTVQYAVEQNYDPHAATVAPETTTKPVMAATFVEAVNKVATIAVTIKVSKQSFMDVPLLNPWLDIPLSYSCNLKEEDMLVNGDSANSIQGLVQLATPRWT
jgi:HK97 family phage major capsid protein